jgi:hypothetical protein
MMGEGGRGAGRSDLLARLAIALLRLALARLPLLRLLLLVRLELRKVAVPRHRFPRARISLLPTRKNIPSGWRRSNSMWA